MRKSANGEGTIYKRKDGRYEARITVGRTEQGHPRRISKISRKRKDVSDWLSEQLAKRNAGDLTEPSRVTFAGWVEHYHASLTVRPNTMDDYHKALAPAIETLGHVKLRELTPARLQAALNEWTKKRTAYQNRKTVKRLRATLAEAERLELIVRNPARTLRLPKTEAQQILVWWAEEAQQVLAYARANDHRLFPFLHVNLVTGLRREEMLGLRWQDVDFEHHELHVRQTITFIAGKADIGEPKTPKSRRTVDLDEDTINVLRTWQSRQQLERQLAGDRWQHTDLVFATPVGKAWAETYLAKVFRSVMEAAGVPRIRLYDLRHCYASIAYEAGVPLKLISDRMGHENIAFTLKTYVHSSKRMRKATAWSASRLFGSAVDRVMAAEGGEGNVAVMLPSKGKKRQDAS